MSLPSESTRGMVRDVPAEVLERITDAFLAVDREWRLTYLNRKAEELLRHPAAELLGRELWEQFPEAVGSAFEREYRRALAEGVPVTLTEYYPPFDRWFEVNAYPGPDGLSVFFRDVTTRQVAALELERSRTHLTLALEAGRMGTWEWDIANGGVIWSQQQEMLCGLEPGTFPGTTEAYLARLHPDDWADAWRAVEEALARRAEAHHVRHRIVRPDGGVRWLESHGRFLYAPDGRPLRLVGVSTDITDQMHFLASRERQSEMLGTVDVGVWYCDLPFSEMQWDHKVREHFWFGSEERITIEMFYARLHPDDRERTRAAIERSIAERLPYDMEYRTVAPAGSPHEGRVRWLRAIGYTGYDRAGRPVRFDGITVDVTTQREAESARDRAVAEQQASQRQLERERTLLREILMQAPAAISVTEGPDHVVVSQNALSRELAGVDLVGKRVAEFFPEVAAQGYLALQDEVYRTGIPFIGREMPVSWDRNGDGVPEQAYFDFIYQPLRDEHGQVIGILSHAVEVTEQVNARREAEHRAGELARIGAALAHSNRELDQFAYIASHDLKAPLRGISNLAHWLEEDLGERLTPESREHLQLLKGRVQRMDGLIDGILAYSRAGRVRTEVEPVDTAALLRDVVELLHVEPSARVELPDDAPVIVIERVPLQQVFLNLIGNGLKFSAAHRPDPAVRVTWHDAGDQVGFAFTDNGPGIAPEYHDRVWGIFQTLNARDKVEGTGIGLSIVKKIVESRGGTVRIESAAGEGATFHILLPKNTRELPSAPVERRGTSALAPHTPATTP